MPTWLEILTLSSSAVEDLSWSEVLPNDQNHYLKHGKTSKWLKSLIWKNKVLTPYQYIGGLMRWNFATDSCITINGGTIDTVRPMLKLPWRDNITDRITNTINASSTVPASIPTVPTVQFRGRTLNKAKDNSFKSWFTSLQPSVY